MFAAEVRYRAADDGAYLLPAGATVKGSVELAGVEVVRKAGLFKDLHCQQGFIGQIEPQRQFGRLPTRGAPYAGGSGSSEQSIQRAVCQHLRQRGASGLVWWHTPNGGHRSRVEGAIFSGLGVRPGVSDLILLRDGRAFALELKTERGRPTAAQMQFLSEFRAAGDEASIASGLDQALHTLEVWGLLRGHASGSQKSVLQSASA